MEKKAKQGCCRAGMFCPQWRAFTPRDVVEGTNSLMKLNNSDFNPWCLITVWSFPVSPSLCRVAFLWNRDICIYWNHAPLHLSLHLSILFSFQGRTAIDLTPWEIQDEPEPVKSRAEDSSASVPVLFYGNQGSKQEPLVVTLWALVWQDKLSH